MHRQPTANWARHRLYTQDYDDYLPCAPDPHTKALLVDCHEWTYFDPVLMQRVAVQPDVRFLLKLYGVVFPQYRCPDDRLDPETIKSCLHPKTTDYDTFGSSYRYFDELGLSVLPLGAFEKPSESVLVEDGDCFHNNNPADGCNGAFWDLLFADFHVKMSTLLQRQQAIDNTDAVVGDGN